MAFSGVRARDSCWRGIYFRQVCISRLISSGFQLAGASRNKCGNLIRHAFKSEIKPLSSTSDLDEDSSESLDSCCRRSIVEDQFSRIALELVREQRHFFNDDGVPLLS